MIMESKNMTNLKNGRLPIAIKKTNTAIIELINTKMPGFQYEFTFAEFETETKPKIISVKWSFNNDFMYGGGQIGQIGTVINITMGVSQVIDNSEERFYEMAGILELFLCNKMLGKFRLLDATNFITTPSRPGQGEMMNFTLTGVLDF